MRKLDRNEGLQQKRAIVNGNSRVPNERQRSTECSACQLFGAERSDHRNSTLKQWQLEQKQKRCTDAQWQNVVTIHWEQPSPRLHNIRKVALCNTKQVSMMAAAQQQQRQAQRSCHHQTNQHGGILLGPKQSREEQSREEVEVPWAWPYK